MSSVVPRLTLMAEMDMLRLVEELMDEAVVVSDRTVDGEVLHEVVGPVRLLTLDSTVRLFDDKTLIPVLFPGLPDPAVYDTCAMA